MALRHPKFGEMNLQSERFKGRVDNDSVAKESLIPGSANKDK